MSHDGTKAEFRQTNQHAEEPQLYVVVLMEPSSINMETVADKEHHGVVGADDQNQKNKSRNHHSVCTGGDGGKHNLTLFVSDIFRTKEQAGGASCEDSYPRSQTSSQPILKHRFTHQLM